MFSRCARLVVLTSVLACGVTVTHAQTLTTRTIATGLSDPRGMAFGPRGDLFVTEAWTAPGTVTTMNCYQSVIGPFTGGFTSRLSRIPAGGGTPRVVADGFPSTAAAIGDTFGLADAAFVDGRLVVLSSGAGCSKGHPTAVNEVLAVSRQGARRRLANLSAWILANPGAKGELELNGPDYEADGVWYSMLADDDRLLVIEANHGLLVEIGDRGRIRLVQDLYRTIGDHTYAAIARDGDDLYVGTYGRFSDNFAGAIYRLRHGRGELVASGLTSVIGIAFDRRHRLYALQAPIFDGGGAGLGSLVRIERDGTATPVLTGLASPGSLTRGPDGAFYVPQCSFHCAPGTSWITRIEVP
jgi:glucose/arabinose dehydrogenase